MSQSKIGKALGVSNACISKLMKKHGIKARKTGRGRPKKGGIKNE
jgi:predicted transcriptional regulator